MKHQDVSPNIKKWGIVIITSVFIYTVFRWLIGLAMPEMAWAFALGITILLIGGLLSGSYLSRIWFNNNTKGQNIVFGIMSMLIVFACVAIGILVNKMIANTEFIHFFFTVISIFLLSASTGAIISLLRHRIKRKIYVAQTAMAHSQSELHLLQSQLSPHFLFNTLNNLYGLSISDPSRLPNLLIKLSDLLRYTVYDTKELFVPLENELEYLKNYIEFEKLRMVDRLVLKHNLDEMTNTAIQIPPMLLIVFVENAFKHSKNSKENKIYIEISLTLLMDSIVFSVKNSFAKSTPSNEIVQKRSGFGLESVKKRLKALYENHHDLKIEVSDVEYSITLKLIEK